MKANLIQQKVAKKSKRFSSLCFLGVLLFQTNVLVLDSTRAQDSLPSWGDTAPKQAIISFVEKVTKDGLAVGTALDEFHFAMEAPG